MVERKITRSFKIEGKDIVAIKTDEWKNALGKKIVQTVEEHNITVKEIDDVIDTLQKQELGKLDKVKEGISKNITIIKTEIKDEIKDPKYQKFKERLANKKINKMFATLKKEKNLESLEAQLKELKTTRVDIVAWETQFKEIKEAVEKNKS